MPSTVQKWMDFFLDSGIPDATAATYATNFANNRMEMSMLGELTKDVLKELDITMMGDIITVMRHAKVVAEKQRSDKVLDDKKKTRELPESLKPYEPKEKRTITKEVRKSVPRVKDEEKEEYVEKTEKKQKKIITIQYSETDKKKNTAKVKHEAKIEKEDSVFDRLGVQDTEDFKQDVKRKPMKPITFADTDMKSEPFKKTKVVRSQATDKTSAFDRLDKPDSTQDGQVSSTDDPPDRMAVQSAAAVSRGILKQRGVIKTGMSRSLSASSIISLKPQQTTKKKARVSFGENDVRCMSPAEPEGIKARLGYNKDQSSDDGEDEDELRPDLRERMQALVKQKTEETMRRAEEEGRRQSSSVTAKPSRNQEDDPVATLVKRKKVYVLQTLSDGTKKKVELPPNHPLLQNRARPVVTVAPARTIRQGSPPPMPRSVARQAEEISSDEEEEVESSLARRVNLASLARQDKNVRDRLAPANQEVKVRLAPAKMEQSVKARLAPVQPRIEQTVKARLAPAKIEQSVKVRLAPAKTEQSVKARLAPVKPKMEPDIRARLETVKPKMEQGVRSRLDPAPQDQDVRVKLESARMEHQRVKLEKSRLELRIKMEEEPFYVEEPVRRKPEPIRRKPEPIIIRQFSADSKYSVKGGGEKFQTLATRASRSASTEITERRLVGRSRSEADLGRMRSAPDTSRTRTSTAEVALGRMRLAEDGANRKRRMVDEDDWRMSSSSAKVRLQDSREVDVDLDAYEEKIARKEARLRTMSEHLLDDSKPDRALYQASDRSRDRYAAPDSRSGHSDGGTMRADEKSRPIGQRLASTAERGSRERSRSPVRSNDRGPQRYQTTDSGIYSRLGPKF